MRESHSLLARGDWSAAPCHWYSVQAESALMKMEGLLNVLIRTFFYLPCLKLSRLAMAQFFLLKVKKM